ncbi:MAG: hypothetical protein E6R03_06180 [Hyphomicrobiaceae bacterium]|nr:MAG: hypothetical protein E6R03_06180 [Hyphomicrobiaceae bacterium]
MSPAERVAEILRARGWDDAKRDCWCRYQGADASLVLRWLVATADLPTLQRLRSEVRDLADALDAVLRPQPKQEGLGF